MALSYRTVCVRSSDVAVFCTKEWTEHFIPDTLKNYENRSGRDIKMKKKILTVSIIVLLVLVTVFFAASGHLRIKYPEYYNLDTSEGVTVYVWQAEDGEYRCGAVSGINRITKFEEISKIASNSTTIDEMKTILASYNIERGYVSVYHIEIMSSYYEEIEDYNEIRDIFWGD